MKKISFLIILFFLLTTFLYATTQRDVEYTGERIEIKTSTGETTEVTFPSDIKNIITAISQNQVSLESSTNHLYIQPISAPEGNLFVITENNVSYPFFIKNVLPEEMDVKVIIKGGKEEMKTKTEIGEETNIVDYIRMLITGEIGSSPKVVKSEKIIFKDERIELTLFRTYIWTLYTGYLCKAKNISKEAIVIPIQQIYLPKLWAVSSDKDVLNPGESTNLYLLVGN